MKTRCIRPNRACSLWLWLKPRILTIGSHGIEPYHKLSLLVSWMSTLCMYILRGATSTETVDPSSSSTSQSTLWAARVDPRGRPQVLPRGRGTPTTRGGPSSRRGYSKTATGSRWCRYVAARPPRRWQWKMNYLSLNLVECGCTFILYFLITFLTISHMKNETI